MHHAMRVHSECEQEAARVRAGKAVLCVKQSKALPVLLLLLLVSPGAGYGCLFFFVGVEHGDSRHRTTSDR
jgi:hypothetical protein